FLATLVIPLPSPSPPSTLSLHDALPIYHWPPSLQGYVSSPLHSHHNKVKSEKHHPYAQQLTKSPHPAPSKALLIELCRAHLQSRSEEHTSELQSRENLVCRLLLDKKKAL